MTVAGYAAGAAVVAVLGAIAAEDARRARIPPALLGFLLAFGAVWLLAGGGREALPGPLWGHALAAALGAGVPGLLILGAELRGARWPIYPGDAMLLGVVGAVLGPRALAWSVALGCGLAVLHRVCVQRRRGRAVTAGYLPAGPGLALGAALVFGAVTGGMAQEPPPDRDAAGGRIEAVEVVPVAGVLPEELADRQIALKVEGELTFPDAVAALGEAAGIAVGIEERPSRIAGGRVTLPEPPPVALGEGGRLGTVAVELARRGGYGWEWRGQKLVFFRYWDGQWAARRLAGVAVPARKPEPPDLFGRVFGFLLGRPEVGRDTAKPPLEAPVDAETAKVAVEPSGGEEAAAETGRIAAEGEREAKDVPQPAEAPATRWEVRPAEQETLRGVLEDWALKAEWRVAWQAEADFSVGAEAVFEGGFLEAVDGLLSDPRLSRVLTARAYANRYLVIRDAGR